MSEKRASYSVSYVADSPEDEFKDIEPWNVHEFRKITMEMTAIYKKKNLDYGDSFAASIHEWGPVAGLVRIQDKFNRAKNLLMNGRTPEVEETVTDTLTDMSVYCILLRMCIEKQMSANGNT